MSHVCDKSVRNLWRIRANNSHVWKMRSANIKVQQSLPFLKLLTFFPELLGEFLLRFDMLRFVLFTKAAFDPTLNITECLFIRKKTGLSFNFRTRLKQPFTCIKNAFCTFTIRSKPWSLSFAVFRLITDNFAQNRKARLIHQISELLDATINICHLV